MMALAQIGIDLQGFTDTILQGVAGIVLVAGVVLGAYILATKR